MNTEQLDRLTLASAKMEQPDSGYSIDIAIAVNKIFRDYLRLGAPKMMQESVMELADVILASPLVTA